MPEPGCDHMDRDAGQEELYNQLGYGLTKLSPASA